MGRIIAFLLCSVAWGQLTPSKAGGSGTVTSVSTGNLSPLFTASVATATTTPALSFALSSASQNLFFASPSGSSGIGSYRAMVTADLPSTIAPAVYQTATACSSGASPAVCGSAPSGAVAVPTGSNSTLVVNTTNVTANSQIFLTSDETLTISGTTCNTTLVAAADPMVVSSRTPGTSFTITVSGTVSTNPKCVAYFIVN